MGKHRLQRTIDARPDADRFQALVRFIGVVEVLSALGLILPPLTGIDPILASVAAIGLVLVQIGAVVFHLRRGEAKALPANLVLQPLAAAAAILGLVVWA